MNDQLRFDGDGERRPRARRSDPWTSHAAADSIAAEALRDSQVQVLRAFFHVPVMCDETLLAVYRDLGLPRQSDSGLRTRRRELADMGYVRDSGETVVLDSGRRSVVWMRTGKEVES